MDEFRTMEGIVQEWMAPQRFNASLLGVFAVVALLLAAVGIYGVLAYSVSQRTREIGLRLALGAQRREVLGLVLRQGFGLVAAALAIGLVGALFLTRLLTAFLFEVSPADPVTFVGVSVVLTVAALFACWIPARRATRIDPMTALRME